MEYEKTPREIAEERMQIAGEFVAKGKRMATLKHIKAVWWRAMRPDYKSDASCERAWDLTNEGEEMTGLQIEMKGMEVRLSALKTMLTVCETEARGIY